MTAAVIQCFDESAPNTCGLRPAPTSVLGRKAGAAANWTLVRTLDEQLGAASLDVQTTTAALRFTLQPEMFELRVPTRLRRLF